MKLKINSGVSLLEILIVVGIFAILGILSTRALSLSLSGSKKSSSTLLVRENAEYALAIIERQMRNAESVDPCPNSNTSTLIYKDEQGAATSFSCVAIGEAGYLASGSARLTSDEVAITACSFVCSPGVADTPPAVTINLVAKDVKAALAKEGGQVTLSTQILLRTY